MTPDQPHDDPTHAEPPPAAPGAEQPQTLPEHEAGPRKWPRVVGVLVLLLGVGGAWIWQNPGFIQNSLGSLFPASTGQDVAIKALEARVARLEQRPDLSKRLDALESRAPAAGTTGATPVDLRPLLARLDALEARTREPPLETVSPDLGPMLARLDVLEKATAAQPGKLDAIAAQLAGLTARDQASEFRGKLDEIEHQLNDISASDAKLSDHATRLARLQIALAAGLPLGPILGSDPPPSLARFATTAPPTEAGLRLAFGTAASAALKVSQPDTEGMPFLDSILARLQDFRLIMVREGDHVLIGNSSAAILAHARALLDAGDLDGAAKAVATMTGPAAEKMAPWLTDATALLKAREALASLAETG